MKTGWWDTKKPTLDWGGDVGVDEIHCGKSQGKACLTTEIAYAKALRQACAWCVAGSKSGLELGGRWEENRWKRQTGSRFCRDLSVVKSQDFVLRAVGSQWRVFSRDRRWSDFHGEPSSGGDVSAFKTKPGTAVSESGIHLSTYLGPLWSLV